MQFASSGSLQDVQAYVASAIAQRGGKLVSSSPAAMSAEFAKKFSWFWFVVMLGVFYLVYWAVSKEQVLTVTYREAEGVVYGYLQAKGKKASRTARAIQHAFTPKQQ
jgi:hypothetical protein